MHQKFCVTRFISIFSFGVFTLGIFTSLSAYAFPENIRHGYVNCTSCHVSPTGGGSLTPYGRALSAELMSTWSYKNEEGFLHGVISQEKMPEWLMIGGDLRGLQTLVDTPQSTTAKWVPMGEDLEVAVKLNKFTIDETYGKIEDPTRPRWGSHRNFLMYNVSDEFTVRLGKFFPAFGLYVPDHYVPTRQGLGFNDGQERENLEFAFNGETWSAFLTASQMTDDTAAPDRENSLEAQLNRNLGESSKVGASVWYGNADTSSRKMLGIHGLFGFTKKFFLLSEFDHQWLLDKTANAAANGFFAYNRMGYELVKGLIGFGQADYAQSNVIQGVTASDAYGVGLQWFPRPHFEFLSVFRKIRARGQGANFSDYGFLMVHYYW